MIFSKEDRLNLLSESTISKMLDAIESIGERLKKLEGPDIEGEKTFLLENAKDADYIAGRYNKTTNNKNNFSTIEIAVLLFGIKDVDLRDEKGKYLKEIDIAILIFAKIQELRN